MNVTNGFCTLCSKLFTRFARNSARLARNAKRFTRNVVVRFRVCKNIKLFTNGERRTMTEEADCNKASWSHRWPKKIQQYFTQIITIACMNTKIQFILKHLLFNSFSSLCVSSLHTRDQRLALGSNKAFSSTSSAGVVTQYCFPAFDRVRLA